MQLRKDAVNTQPGSRAGIGRWPRHQTKAILLSMKRRVSIALPITIVALALSLVLGGALGNLAGRVKYGYVVDFVDVHHAGWHFPAFNVADAAITCGVILLLLDAVLVHFRTRKKAG